MSREFCRVITNVLLFVSSTELRVRAGYTDLLSWDGSFLSKIGNLVILEIAKTH